MLLVEKQRNSNRWAKKPAETHLGTHKTMPTEEFTLSRLKSGITRNRDLIPHLQGCSPLP
jgi:hypothetical protein